MFYFYFSALVTCSLLVKGSAQIHKISFGSCNKIENSQPIWDAIIEQQSDLWLWLGDAVYVDHFEGFKRVPSPLSDMENTYNEQKHRENYTRFLDSFRKRPNSIYPKNVIGVWDDHDYGQNDGDMSYDDKVEAQKLFLDFLEEPQNSERRKQKGVYATYTYGEIGHQVRVILLDGRYHRNETHILGDEQWKWFENVIKTSESQVHVIGTGIQIIADDKHSFLPFAENWGFYPEERRKLFDILAAERVPGVVILTGDIHLAEINRILCSGLPYEVYDITSSGMTHSWDSYFKYVPYGENILKWICENAVPRRFMVGNQFTGLNFGTLEIQWPEKSENGHVEIIAKIHDVHGKVQREQKISFQENPSICNEEQHKFEWTPANPSRVKRLRTIFDPIDYVRNRSSLEFIFLIVVILSPCWLTGYCCCKMCCKQRKQEHLKQS